MTSFAFFHRHSIFSQMTISALIVLLLMASPLPGAAYDSLGNIDLTGIDPVNSNPYGLAMHPTLPLGYVALAGVVDFTQPQDLTNGRSVAEFDLATLQVTRTFGVGLYPTEIVVAADGSELYVTSSTDATLSFVNLTTGVVSPLAITDSGGVPVGYLAGVELSADGTQLYVVSNGGNFDGSDENIVIVDRVTRSIVGRQTLAGTMSRFAVLSSGRVVLPVGFPGNDFLAVPQLRLYDPATNPWTELLSVALTVNTAAYPAPVDVAITSDESRAYVTVFEGSSEIFVIDLVNLTLLPAIPLPLVDHAQHGLDISDDDTRLFFTDLLAGQLRVIDVNSQSVIATVPTGAQPNEVVVHGGRAWVTEQGAISIAVIELPGSFARGDTNGDGAINLTDGVHIVNFLFGGAVLACGDTADINDDGGVALDDAILLLNYMFASGPAPAYPFPQPGGDLTADGLSCP